MHVVQILPALEAGGVERGTLEIAAALVRSGHRSTVISSGGRMVAALVAAGSYHLDMPVHAKRLATLSQIAPLRNALAALQPDIVHARSRLPAWLAWLAIGRLPLDRRPRFVTTVHGLYSVNPYSGIMTRGERVIAISSAVRDYVFVHYRRCPREAVRLIHRGVDAAEFPRGHSPPPVWQQALRAEFPQVAGKRLLLLPGRLVRWKGGLTFLRLLAEVLPGACGCPWRARRGRGHAAERLPGRTRAGVSPPGSPGTGHVRGTSVGPARVACGRGTGLQSVHPPGTVRAHGHRGV